LVEDVEGAQKDAEDTFGMLKGRFHYIKKWNKLNKQETVDRVFITCCILHNMQLELDGFTDPDLCPPAASALRNYRQDRRGNCCWRRTQGNRDIGEANVLPMDMGGSDQRQWSRRMCVLRDRFIMHVKQNTD
jgi:hypothetical protein